MLSKEEIEKDNTFKISMPLITEEDKRKIDNNFETIVAEFTKSYVKEKDLALTQYVMKKQQDKIDQLESDKQKLIEKLEEEKFKIESTYSKINENYFMAQDRLDLIQEILSIIKGK
ncbi:MAG: hypothetical protein ACI31S_01530 [Bacilli bacterium]